LVGWDGGCILVSGVDVRRGGCMYGWIDGCYGDSGNGGRVINVSWRRRKLTFSWDALLLTSLLMEYLCRMENDAQTERRGQMKGRSHGIRLYLLHLLSVCLCDKKE